MTALLLVLWRYGVQCYIWWCFSVIHFQHCFPFLYTARSFQTSYSEAVLPVVFHVNLVFMICCKAVYRTVNSLAWPWIVLHRLPFWFWPGGRAHFSFLRPGLRVMILDSSRNGFCCCLNDVCKAVFNYRSFLSSVTTSFVSSILRMF